MVTIGELVELVRGTTYKSALLGDEGPVLLGLGTIERDGGFRSAKLKRYSGESRDRLLIQAGELYVSLKDVTQAGDLLGAVAMVPDSIGVGRLTQDTVHLKFKDASFPKKYLYWLLRTPQYRAFCRSCGMGTTNLSLDRDDFLNYEIPVLDDGRQVLYSLLEDIEAKIDLLHRQNKTLEGMAEALFRQWFVEEQWEERAIEEIAVRVACGPFGSSIKTDTFVDEGVPIISGQHLWGVLMEDNTFNYVTPEHAERLSKAKVRRGDVIFTHAGSIGQAALIPESSRYEEYVLSQRQFFMRCDRSKVLPLYITMYFHTREGKHQLLGNTSTSGVPSIARPVSFLRSMLVPVPPIEVQQEFERVVGALYAKVQLNKKETGTLTKLRDTLLPKLMSGEVRVEVKRKAD